jgi:hypothetical protein
MKITIDIDETYYKLLSEWHIDYNKKASKASRKMSGHEDITLEEAAFEAIKLTLTLYECQKIKENHMRTYKLMKQKAGQHAELLGHIYASDFEKAKQEFAQSIKTELTNNTDGIWEYFNEGIIKQWKEDEVKADGYTVPGWYRMCYIHEIELGLSDDDIQEGIESWSDDGTTWFIDPQPIDEDFE